MTEIWSLGIDAAASFNPTRLTLARERQGLTKQRLAELCGVSRKTVSLWEAGEVDNPPVVRISETLDFPVGFFYADDLPEVRPDWVSFRALTSLSARQVSRVIASSRLAVEFAEWVDRRYKTPPLEIPVIADNAPMSPVAMAENTRSAWNLSDRPIANILGLLEKHGVRVFSLPSGDREVDAFSFYREDRAYVFLNTGKTAERLRFDLAHELGHLVLHRNSKKNRSKELEQEANRFASSFLVSADRLNAQIVGTLRFDDIFKLKQYWRVSAMAMVERLWQLQHISDWIRRQWIIELMKRGYRADEPDGIRPEQSKFFMQLFKLMREDGYSIKKVAETMNVKPRYLDDCVFGLAISTVDGEGDDVEPPRRGHLQRVK
jgi:Zn-dependent peptidase ImmA (M78 family)/transcriptional regulator with XRE-family HTH domain